MFENKTFENILSNMLSYVSDRNSELDTREGSIIYTALAPIALELETAYHEMDMILEETFLETASKEYLVKHGDQLGLELNEATCGHYKGEFNVDVEIGSRFNLDKFNYNVIDKLSDPTEGNPYYVFELVCETAGSEPNTYFGDLTPITYVAKLSYAKLTSVITYGEDEEDTEVFRYRLQTHIKNPPINGNLAYYNELLNEYDGVGKYRITPLWNGANTVKVTILNSENTPASDELVAEVQEYLDPNSEGMGNGQIPLGAMVTVDTVSSTPVTISCTLTLKDGYNEVVIVESVKTSINEYLESLALDESTVSYMRIMAAIYNTDGVGYVQSLTVEVNGVVMNPEADEFISTTTIGDNEIGVLNEASVIEVI